jgi:PAS domain S-box-containing protein
LTNDVVMTSELFDLLAKATCDAVWHWDLDTNTVWWNEGFTTHFGYTLLATDYLPATFYEHVHPDDKSRVLKDIQKAIEKGGASEASEYRYNRMDGTVAVIAEKRYVLYQGDRATRMIGAMQVVDERVTVPKVRNEGEERLRLALESAQIGTWEFDPIRNVSSWDERCGELLGWVNSGLTYEQGLENIHPDDRERVNKAVQWALDPQSGGIYDSSFRTIGAQDGKLRWVRFVGKAYFTDTGEAYRLTGLGQHITAEVLAKEKAALAEQQVRMDIEGSGSGSFSIDIDTNQMLYSPSLARLFTGEESNSIDRDVLIDHLHPDDRSIRDRAYELAAQTNAIHYEARFIWKDKSVHWVKVIGQYLFNSAGKPVTLSGIALDITEQKEQGKALREAEQRFSIAFNNASIGMTFTDERGNFTLPNKAFAQLLGYSTQELTGVNFLDMTHPDHQQENKELFDEIIRGERHFFNFTKRYIHKDGSERWVQLNVTRIDEARDTIHGVLVIAHDINVEMTTQKALADREALFRNITNASTAALWITNQHAGITYVSQKWVDWTGAPLEKHLGTGWLQFVAAPDRHPAATRLLADISAFRYHESQFRVEHLDGTIRWVVCTGTPQYTATGEFTGYIGAILDISDRVRAEDKLRASEERFRGMINQAPVAIGILNGRDMMVETANLPILEIWGKDASIIGLPLAQALPEIVGQGFLELLETVYDSGNAHYGFETLAWLHRRGKLEEAYFNFVYAPVREDTSAVSGVIVIATEVTQQVKAKKELQESEQRFRNLIAEAPVATSLFLGRDLLIDMPNEAMIRLWGKTNSIIGKPLREAIPEIQGQPFLDILDDIYTTGNEYSAQEARADLVVNGQLRTYYFNFTYKPLRNAAGDVYAILDMAIDVTDQVIARRSIEESELRFRTLMEAIAQMTWTHTPDGKTNFHNQRWHDYTGMNLDQTKGDGWKAALHPDDLAITEQLLEQSLGEGTVFVVENRYRRGSDGMYRWHLNRALPIRDESGEITLWVGTATDIHEQKQLAANLEELVQARTQELEASNFDLRRSNENLEKFAYIASHDLQEPLRKIQSFGGILRDQYASQLGDGADHLERMHKAAGRMSLLIKDLLTFSRISTRQEAAAPIALNNVLTEVLEDLEVTVQQSGGNIIVDELPTILGDASQLRQLFQNLLSNALKFRQAGVEPMIHIQSRSVLKGSLPRTVRPARSASMYYCISVSDNGIGFDEKYIDRIFQVFQRLHGRNEYAGTGIGLAICEKVVANHGGAITAESQPGRGATFLIYLPIGK